MPDETDEERKIYQNFITTFKIGGQIDLNLSEEEKKRIEDEIKLGDDVARYIIRTLNSSSLRGYIYYNQYVSALKEGVKGLFKLIYLNNFSYDLMARDVAFVSSATFFKLLLTRVYEGRDYAYLMKGLEKYVPTIVRT